MQADKGGFEAKNGRIRVFLPKRVCEITNL